MGLVLSCCTETPFPKVSDSETKKTFSKGLLVVKLGVKLHWHTLFQKCIGTLFQRSWHRGWCLFQSLAYQGEWCLFQSPLPGMECAFSKAPLQFQVALHCLGKGLKDQGLGQALMAAVLGLHCKAHDPTLPALFDDITVIIKDASGTQPPAPIQLTIFFGSAVGAVDPLEPFPKLFRQQVPHLPLDLALSPPCLHIRQDVDMGTVHQLSQGHHIFTGDPVASLHGVVPVL